MKFRFFLVGEDHTAFAYDVEAVDLCAAAIEVDEQYPEASIDGYMRMDCAPNNQ